MIFGSLGVEISLETLTWNKKTQWNLYLGIGLHPLVVLNPNAYTSAGRGFDNGYFFSFCLGSRIEAY